MDPHGILVLTFNPQRAAEAEQEDAEEERLTEADEMAATEADVDRYIEGVRDDIDRKPSA